MSEGLVDFNIDLPDGCAASFPVHVKSTGPACFALSLRKSGSSIFSNLVTAIAKHNNRNVIDIPGNMFEKNIGYPEWNSNKLLTSLLWRGNVYVGYRDGPTVFYNDPIFIDGVKLLLVRDPRDALVSEYFSNVYSHSIPMGGAETSVISIERAKAQKASLEDYVLKRAAALDRTFRQYAPILEDPKLRIIRYEDFVFKKEEWLHTIADVFGMEVDEILTAQILGSADIVPSEQDPKAFVRHVVPGDYKEKLSVATIRKVEEELSDIWWSIGYVKTG